MANKLVLLPFDIIRLPHYLAAMEKTQQYSDVKQPGLGRVLGAIVYDGLALLALFMIAGFIFVPILGHPPATTIEHISFQLILFTVTYLFFCWFWTHGGQTLGMRAWKIKLLHKQDVAVSWPVATQRFFLAILSWLPLGLGFLWILFNSNRLSWHDRLSNTYLIFIPNQRQAQQLKKI